MHDPPLASVPELAGEILAGRVRGRVVLETAAGERRGAAAHAQDGGRSSCAALKPSIASEPGSRR